MECSLGRRSLLETLSCKRSFCKRSSCERSWVKRLLVERLCSRQWGVVFLVLSLVLLVSLVLVSVFAYFSWFACVFWSSSCLRYVWLAWFAFCIRRRIFSVCAVIQVTGETTDIGVRGVRMVRNAALVGARFFRVAFGGSSMRLVVIARAATAATVCAASSSVKLLLLRWVLLLSRSYRSYRSSS